jgi:hypothetical protein
MRSALAEIAPALSQDSGGLACDAIIQMLEQAKLSVSVK